MSVPKDPPSPADRANGREKLSELLKRLAHEFAEHPLGFEELVRATQGRAYDVLLIFLSLPFLTPIPLPLLSTAVGSVMALIGARLALGQRPWLPKRVLEHRIDGHHLVRVLEAASSVVRWLELLLRPRLQFVHTTWIFQRLAGVLIAISGVLLLLPLPIPLSNILPAATVLLLAAGALERDGVFFFAGVLLFMLNLVFFGALAFGGIEVAHWAFGWTGWGGDAE